VLLPIHIAFLHLVIDPACSVVFEAQPPEDDVMRRPPRAPTAPIFSREVVLLSLAQGAGVMVAVLALYAVALHTGRTEAASRALTFSAFLVANLGLIFVNRSWHTPVLGASLKDPTLWAVTGGAMAFLAIVLYVPPLAALFRFAPLGPLDVALCIGVGGLSVAWFEVFKWARRRRRKP